MVEDSPPRTVKKYVLHHFHPFARLIVHFNRKPVPTPRGKKAAVKEATPSKRVALPLPRRQTVKQAQEEAAAKKSKGTKAPK